MLGNVSQGSIFWIPPRDVTDGDPDQLFEIHLWDMKIQMGCSSPAFKFAEVDEKNDTDTTQVPYGPFVTTAISILNTGYVTATATVATYESGVPQFEQQVTGSITATDGVKPSGTAASTTSSSSTSTSTSTSMSNSGVDNDNSKSSEPNKLAIIIGTVIGVLVAALLVLSILLWRSRRKRATARSRSDSVTDAKDISLLSTPQSQLSEADSGHAGVAEVPGHSTRHEMDIDSAPQELPTQEMAPVELPADEIPPPSYPGHSGWDMSPTTASRRSSLSFDKGTFTVSPIRERRDRKE